MGGQPWLPTHSSLKQEGSGGGGGVAVSLQGLLSLPQGSGEGLLTVLGQAPVPGVCCRWQLKISSALRRYLATFSFTASRLSLLGSTVGDQESPFVVTRTAPYPLSWAYWWAQMQAPVNYLCLSRPMAPTSQTELAGSPSPPPPLCLRASSGKKDARGNWKPQSPLQPTAPHSWYPSPPWLFSHPGEEQSGDSL